MRKNQLVRHAHATVRFKIKRTGMTGSRATFSSTKTNANRRTAERGSDVSTRGWLQGTMLPPELRPSRSKTSVATSNEEPRKSTRLSFGVSDFAETFVGFSTWMNIIIKEATVNGICTRNASFQSHTSFRKPPNTPPSPLPSPQHTLLMPCHSPR